MFVAFFVFFIFLLFPKITSAGMHNGLSLLAEQVIPALYPFIFVTTFLKSRIRFQNSSRFLCLIPGFLSGYPLGAKIVSDYWNENSHIPPQAMLIICNNPSPSYMISFVGLSCLGNPKLGFLIYIVILTANLITGILITLRNHYFSSCRPKLPISSIYIASTSTISEIIDDTFHILINISGYILIFSVAASFIQAMTFIPDAFQGILAGFLEMTSGIQLLSSSSINTPTKLIGITGITCFGGLSVIAQTQSMMNSPFLSIKKYMTEKAAASAIAMSVMYCILRFIRI